MKTEQPAALAAKPHSAGEPNVPKKSPWSLSQHDLCSAWTVTQVNGGGDDGGG